MSYLLCDGRVKSNEFEFQDLKSKEGKVADATLMQMYRTETHHYGIKISLQEGRFNNWPVGNDKKIRVCKLVQIGKNLLTAVILEGDLKDKKFDKANSANLNA